MLSGIVKAAALLPSGAMCALFQSKGPLSSSLSVKIDVSSQRAEHVKGPLHLRDTPAPQFEGTVDICSCNGGDDVVLDGLHCWFTCVDLTIGGHHNMDWDPLGCNGRFYSVGSLVIEGVEVWRVALLFEFSVYDLEGRHRTCIFS